MRTPSSNQIEALRAVASWYERNGFSIRMNDGHLCSFPLDCQGRRVEPPLIVWEGQRLVRFVAVETEDSLDAMAPIRWRQSLNAGVPLHVYVPTKSYETAWQLRTEARAMDAHLLTYTTETGTGQLFG
jgi:hypothetical protein